MAEKSDRKRNMGIALNWQKEIEVIAGPKTPSDTWESWLARAARRSGASFRQIKALYYGETNDPRYQVAAGVITAAHKARQEARDMASQFESLAGAMNASDSDFYSEDVLALLHAARALRGVDRT